MKFTIIQLKNLLSEKIIKNNENETDFFYSYESKNSNFDLDNLVC